MIFLLNELKMLCFFPEKLKIDEKKEVVEKFDHLSKLKFSPYNPKAFTEKGLCWLEGSGPNPEIYFCRPQSNKDLSRGGNK